MKITFLGTGGGRFATISQKRMTGGFRIDDVDGKNYHIDPGPGALVRSYQFGIQPTSLDGIFVSHAHTDHYTDVEVLIEAMTRGMTKENGVVIGSRSVFEGFQKWGPCVSKYHMGKSDKLILGPNKTKMLGNTRIKGTKTIHGDPTCVGFQIQTNDLAISYTSDTKYFDKLHKYHKNADILIGSVIRPGSKSIKGHMCTANFSKLVEEIQPKLAIMTHFGFKMLSENPANESKSIREKTGIRTLAAFDGMKIEINNNDPNLINVVKIKNKYTTSDKNVSPKVNPVSKDQQTFLDKGNINRNTFVKDFSYKNDNKKY
ncbi:MAG: MBL fold metallo-hydrolase [Methanobrevibacter sp.]|nr:MBL fold metallo-hydrolase [Methanobrevibacter sp.]